MKKLSWVLKRHPFLYYVRFKLLSKTGSNKLTEEDCYNEVNSITEIPDFYIEINNKIFNTYKGNTDLDKVLHIALWLRSNMPGGPGLSVDSESALRKMLGGQGGVCSDLAQIFNNFCVINGLKVREWGVTVTPFDANYGGHSFNEVFISELGKWVAIDVSYLVLFSDKDNNYLSALQLFKRPAISRFSSVKLDYFGEESFDQEERLNSYYKNNKSAPFLILNYKNIIYDHYLKRYADTIPIFIIHFLIYLRRESYYYVFPFHCPKDLFKLKG